MTELYPKPLAQSEPITVVNQNKSIRILSASSGIDLFFLTDYNYQIMSDFRVSMEFRTVKRNGILLSLSDIHEYPALTLEINDGQVNGKV